MRTNHMFICHTYACGYNEEGLLLPPLSLCCLMGNEHFELPDGVSPLRVLVAELRNEDHQEHPQAERHTQRQGEGQELRDQQTEKDSRKDTVDHRQNPGQGKEALPPART